jgi:hypothetical protein
VLVIGVGIVVPLICTAKPKPQNPLHFQSTEELKAMCSALAQLKAGEVGHDRRADRLTASAAQEKAKPEEGAERTRPPGQPDSMYEDRESRLEVGGEAQYQRALRELCRPREEGDALITEAEVVCEETNKMDTHAVKVQSGRKG